MLSELLRPRRSSVLLAVGVIALSAAATLAARPILVSQPQEQIQACVRMPHGFVRIVSSAAECRRNERPISWDAHGQKGDRGPTGPQGPAGTPGTVLSSVDQLQGLACTVAGIAGTTHIDWDAARHATLSCSGASGGGGPGSATVRINELSTGSPTSASDEFVELVNSGTASADIGGFRVAYRSAAGVSDTTLATIPDGTMLAPGAFYLLGGSGYAGSPVADQSFSTGLAGTSGGVGLRDSAGTLVDSVGYGSATNAFVEGSPAAAPAAGSSAARIPDGHDTNDNATDFTVTATPTPRASNH